MHCRTAQRQMALAVGEDLPQAEAIDLNVHLADCASCQQAWTQHQRSFAALQSSRVEPDAPQRTTVWPMVARRIQRRALAPHRVELNGWIASLVVMAASVLVFVFSQEELDTLKTSEVQRPLIGGTPVLLVPDASSPIHSLQPNPRTPRRASSQHSGIL